MSEQPPISGIVYKDANITYRDSPSEMDILKDLSSLFNFDKEIAKIYKPTPAPAPIKPLAKDAFQISPFIEKVLSDPYETIDLSKISKAELSIDNVFSYLSKLIPEDLLNEIKNDIGIAKSLLDKGMSLEAYVKDVASKLPKSLSLPELLRFANLNDIGLNIDGLTSAASSFGLDINDLPGNFVGKGLSMMSKMKTVFNVADFTDQYNKIGNNGSLFDLSTYGSNPIAGAAIAISSVDSLISSDINLTQVLSSIGLPSTGDMAKYLDDISASAFSTIAAGSQIIGSDSATTIVTDITTNGANYVKGAIDNIYDKFHDPDIIEVSIDDVVWEFSSSVKKVGNGNAQIIADMVTNTATHASAVKIGKSIGTYGSVTISAINDSVIANGVVTTRTIVQTILDAISNYPIKSLTVLLTRVNDIGVAAYITTYGAGVYTDILALITTYGISLITILANATISIGNNTIIANVNAINALGTSNVTTLINISTDTTDQDVADTIVNVANLDVLMVTSVLNYANLHGGARLADIINAIKTLGIDDLKKYITTLDTTDTDTLLLVLKDINQLSTSNIAKLTTQLSQQDIYGVFESYGVSGVFLDFSVKETCKICAENGNYKILVKLINTYPGTLSNVFRKSLVNELLTNFVLSDDNFNLGVNLASERFVNALNAISNNWSTDVRDSESISSLYPFLQASDDALKLLLHSQAYAVPAILQIDNKYKFI